MKSQNEIITDLATKCATQKIELVATGTGAIVNARIFKGDPIYRAMYKKGKIKIYENGKEIKTVDIIDRPGVEDKKAYKKKPKNNKATSKL